jgi:uncharacterized protein YneF (UPF0154 family)
MKKGTLSLVILLIFFFCSCNNADKTDKKFPLLNRAQQIKEIQKSLTIEQADYMALLYGSKASQEKINETFKKFKDSNEVRVKEKGRNTLFNFSQDDSHVSGDSLIENKEYDRYSPEGNGKTYQRFMGKFVSVQHFTKRINDVTISVPFLYTPYPVFHKGKPTQLRIKVQPAPYDPANFTFTGMNVGTIVGRYFPADLEEGSQGNFVCNFTGSCSEQRTVLITPDNRVVMKPGWHEGSPWLGGKEIENGIIVQAAFNDINTYTIDGYFIISLAKPYPKNCSFKIPPRLNLESKWQCTSSGGMQRD